MAKISFCTTCMGRLKYLDQTLESNLKLTKNDIDIDFSVIAYGDLKTAEYLLAKYESEILSGKLVVGYYESKYFNLPHAKNIAYRISSGKYLCNLDSDTYLSDQFILFLKSQLSNLKKGSFLKRQWSLNPEESTSINALGLQRRGLAGRLAVKREDFYQIRGYCEKFKGWGIDDVEIELRLINNGYIGIDIPLDVMGPTIRHLDEVRLHNYDFATQKKTNEILKNGVINTKYYESLLKVRETNTNGKFGCGKVLINNKRYILLEAIN